MKKLFDFREQQLSNSCLKSLVGGRGGSTNPTVVYGESSATNEETGMGDCTDTTIHETNDDGSTESCKQWDCPQ